jgi:ATP-dependent Clp protease ATP-binding subunit ClpC
MTPNEEDFRNLPRNDSYNDDSGQDDSLKESNFNNPAINPTKNQNTVLDNFGRDLTEMAEEGKLDPVVGRKRNRTCFQILSRRKKTIHYL